MCEKVRIDSIALAIELKKRKWTLKKLAKESLLSYQTLKNINRGFSVSQETLTDICLTLDIDEDVLLKGTNYRKEVI